MLSFLGLRNSHRALSFTVRSDEHVLIHARPIILVSSPLYSVYDLGSRKFCPRSFQCIWTVASGPSESNSHIFVLRPTPLPINTSGGGVTPCSAPFLFFFFSLAVPLPAPLPSIHPLFGIIDMSLTGDNEQCVRELKGSVGGTWTVEGFPLSEWRRNRAEENFLMKVEKADWSLQKRTRDQLCAPRAGPMTL